MFSDARSKRVVFCAHCMLNQNSISDGTADFEAANRDIIEVIYNAGVGIVQMPCPELMCLGLDRGDKDGAKREVTAENTRIRREMLKKENVLKMNILVDMVMTQIREYRKNGFEILGIIGSDRSPCCGVNTTSDNDVEIEGKGVFIEALCKALSDENIDIPVIGIKADKSYIGKIAEKIGLVSYYKHKICANIEKYIEK